MTDKNLRDRVAAGDDALVPELRELASNVLERFSLASDDERLRDSFELAVEATRRKLDQLGVADLSDKESKLVAKREFVQIFPAAHDEAIRTQLQSSDKALRAEIVGVVDRVAQPDASVELDWKWADPDRWVFPSVSGRDTYDYGILLASRAGCIVFFQNKGLDEKGFDPVLFAKRLLEIRDDAELLELCQAARECTPAHWN